jgi:hypothetical protein
METRVESMGRWGLMGREVRKGAAKSACFCLVCRLRPQRLYWPNRSIKLKASVAAKQHVHIVFWRVWHSE